MLDLGYRLILLLPATGFPALPVSLFRLGVSYQAHMENPLPEVRLPGYMQPDLLGPMDAQNLCKNDVGEDEGSLGVPNPTNNPPPLR